LVCSRHGWQVHAVGFAALDLKGPKDPKASAPRCAARAALGMPITLALKPTA